MGSVLIIMNNYFHDVATAVLLAGAVVMWVLLRRAEAGGPDATAALARAYPTLSKFVLGALVWIIVGGVPRLIFFPDFEFIPAVEKDIVPALVIKHVLMFGSVGIGAYMWRRVARLMKAAGASSGETLEAASRSAPDGEA